MWQIAFVIAVLASIFLLRLYAEKGTPVAIMIPVLISWSLGFFFFLVLPFDLEHALCRKCRRDGLTQEEKDECACLAGDGGMGIDQLRDLIPAAYTCAAPHEPATASARTRRHARAQGDDAPRLPDERPAPRVRRLGRVHQARQVAGRAARGGDVLRAGAAHRHGDDANGLLFQKAFDCPSLKVGIVKDTVGVELCGALKNIVAIGAGFVDGLGYGGNTKAAIMRIGLLEMKKFCNMFYNDIDDDTFLESCGVADLITTCFGGRNRKCAEAFAAAGKKKSLDEIEAELLGGQKLQGTLTAKEVNHVLKMKGLEHEFPFFTAVYKISYEDTPLEAICTTPY